MTEHRPAKFRTTLADVAAMAGVSQNTASKVMRGTGSISDDTRHRVKSAASELGYVPNRLAGSLSSQTSDLVAVILPSIGDAVFGDVVSGINEILRPRGYLTFIGETNFDPDLEAEVIQTVLTLQPAGVILTGGINRTSAAHQMLKKWKCPVIQIWDDENDVYDGCVSPSHTEAGQVIAQHFLENGIRCPAYVGAELKKDICAARRLAAFKEAIENAGLELVEKTDECLPRQSESGRTLVSELMRSHPDVDAIFFLNDAMALGGLSWLYEAGYSVPGQVAVAGFNGTSLIHSVRTRLTTVYVERQVLGQTAADALLKSIENSPYDRRTIWRAELSKGNTT